MPNNFTLRSFIKKIKNSNKSFKYRVSASKKLCMTFSSMLYKYAFSKKSSNIPLKYNSTYFKFYKNPSDKDKHTLKFSKSTPLLTKNHHINSLSYDNNIFNTWDAPFLELLFSKKKIYKSYRYSFETRLINYMSHNYIVNEPKGSSLWIENMLKDIKLSQNDIFLSYIKKNLKYIKKHDNYRMFEEMHYNIVLSLFRFNKNRQYNSIKKDRSLRKHVDLIKKKIAFPHITSHSMISSMRACNISEETIESTISYICWSTTFHDLIPQPKNNLSKSI